MHDAEGLLVPDPQKAEIVRFIFQLYLDGMSLSRISKELQKRQIPSPTGKETWTSRAIDKLLSNEKIHWKCTSSENLCGESLYRRARKE